MNKKVF